MFSATIPQGEQQKLKRKQKTLFPTNLNLNLTRRTCLVMIGWMVLLLTTIPFLCLVYYYQQQQQQQQQTSVYISSSQHAPIVQYPAKQLCCPKVFLYNPLDILERVHELQHHNNLQFTDLDPLNTDAVLFHQYRNTSVPPPERIPLLSEVLRWLPDTANRPLTHLDKMFAEDTSEPGALMYYSKDYVHMFHLRLAVSGCVVADPKEADLFIIPISVHTDHPYGKKKGFQNKWNTFFTEVTNFQTLFPYLTPETARKHVLFSSSFGHSRHSVGLWTPPYKDPKVKLMQRVALGSDYLIRQSYGKWLKYVMHTPERVISAPFATLLTYPHKFLNITAQKTILVSSFLEFHGKAKALRVALNNMCEVSSQCWNKNNILAMQNTSRSKMQQVAVFLKAKTKSTFCLEPEGDWPTRQSMVQDVLLTCIPVFFTHSYRHLWTTFWGNFIQEASVELDGEAVLRGDVDVMQYLEAISPAEIQHKQELLRHHRQQLLYLDMEDYIDFGHNYKHQCAVDASNLLLRQLYLESKIQ